MIPTTAAMNQQLPMLPWFMSLRSISFEMKVGLANASWNKQILNLVLNFEIGIEGTLLETDCFLFFLVQLGIQLNINRSTKLTNDS